MGKPPDMESFFAKRDTEEWAYLSLMVAAFGAAFSLLIGRSFLVASFVLLVIHLCRNRKVIVLPSMFWFWLFFVLVAGVATALGVNPKMGFLKMQKLAWFIAIPLCATLVTTFQRLTGVLKAYALGVGVEAAKTIIMNPVHAVAELKKGVLPDFMFALVNEGSMTYAQVLMLGLVLVLGLVLSCRAENRRWVWWGLVLFLVVIAEVMMFKRGSWVCTCLLLTIFVATKTNWKYLLILGLVVISSLALPSVRARLLNIRKEFDPAKGGRIAMWTEIAPVLIREHPFGIGYRCLTPEMMKKICMAVEPNRNHLHSNIAQVLVESGWLGLLVYLGWMGTAMFDAGRLMKVTRGGPPGASMYSFVLLLMVIGLFANGLVEYNFGDAEIILSYGIVLGCIAAFRRLTPVTV